MGNPAHRDYHVDLAKYFYSAPHTLATQMLEARRTQHTIELFFGGKRVASHVRDDTPYKYTTDVAHVPPRHRHHADCFGSVLAVGAERRAVRSGDGGPGWPFQTCVPGVFTDTRTAWERISEDNF